MLVLLVVVYQLGLVRWVNNTFGELAHLSAEFFLYALVGPLLIYGALRFIGRWLDEEDETARLASVHEHHLAAIASTSVEAIISINADGLIDSWNHGAELLFGYESAEIHGQPFSVLIEGQEATEVELHWLVETVQRAGFVRGHETVCQDIGGRVINVELSATHLAEDSGSHPSISIILHDVTRRKRHEEDIQRLNTRLNQQLTEQNRELATKVEELAQANADLQNLDQSRSEFVSLVSHQIRAPLTNMGGAMQRMEANCGAINPTCTRMFTVLDQQVSRLDRLVQDVLNASRLESGEVSLQPEPISVQPVVQRVVEQTRARVATRPTYLPDKPGLPMVFADRDWVVEILVNLLDNADKYSPPGEEVALEVRAEQTEVTISIRDRGPGLPAEDVERVFDKFYRTDSSDSQVAYGYGLGLYVCRRLVEAQGGRIWAENHPDGGAVFSFSLPVWQG
jgi:PAS domain S-box-containing protein